MKVLSILQPWASLCVNTDSNGKALKQIETRSWNTKYRGKLLIHASKKKIRLQDGMYDLIDHLGKTGFIELFPDLPYGSVIGMVELTNTFRTENIDSSADLYQQSMLVDSDCNKFEGNIATISPSEYAFGDFSDGRFGWLFKNPILFKEPIPCKGQLSIWNLPKELEPEVNKQILLASPQLECNNCEWTGNLDSAKSDEGAMYCPQCGSFNLYQNY